MLLGDIGWRADRRQMYDREVAVPRLLRWYGGDETLPHPLLTEARERHRINALALAAQGQDDFSLRIRGRAPPAQVPTASAGRAGED